MKVSGFTFVRNAVKFDYPIIESIRSILPIVDEYIVNIGDSEDDTVGIIKSIGNPKLKIIESVWDESLKKDGLIYSHQTNTALDQCIGDWAFYLQADEVVHENDLDKIVRCMEKNLRNEEILGMMFRYRHFKGDYWSIDPWMYRKEIRVIRNNGKVMSFGDATGFCCVTDNPQKNIKDGPKNRWVYSGAKVFHYGWVKHPKIMNEKKKEQTLHYHKKIPDSERIFFEREEYPYNEYEILKEFSQSHPKVMEERVKNARRLRPRRNRWLNWRFYKEVFTHGFKG